jgi:Leucine-rich repeat (LRR) protein
MRKTIEFLNVSENLIKALKRDDTKFFTQLRIFNASFNEIKTLEPNTFLEAKKLEVISLSHNQLVNPTFENLDSLKKLFLKGNALTKVGNITSDTKKSKLSVLF